MTCLVKLSLITGVADLKNQLTSFCSAIQEIALEWKTSACIRFCK